jgi:hypothetical protein
MVDDFSFDKYKPEAYEDKKEVVQVELKKEPVNPAISFEKENSKKINFKEMPKSAEEILGNQQKEMIDKFIKEEPVSVPLENNQFQTHLSLILHPDLRELELMIRGLEYVKRFNPVSGKEEIILRKIVGHALNEYGVNKILEFIRVFISSEIKLGRRTQKDAIESAQQIGADAKRLIYKNLKAFGMDTQSKQRNAKIYVLAIFEFAYSALSRSIEGRENDASRPTEYSVQGFSDAAEAQGIYGMSKQKKEGLKN